MSAVMTESNIKNFSVNAPRVDWFELLACLTRHGVNNTRVAQLCALTRDEVRSAKSGHEPRYLAGTLMKRLHDRHCEDDHPKGCFSPHGAVSKA